MNTVKESNAYHLIVIAVFLGLLLTASVFFFADATVGAGSTVTTECYDGSTFYGTGPLDTFRRAVFQNKTLLSFIREYEYRLFHIVGNSEVLAGRDGFLFEVENKENGYHYVEDYLGNVSFTEEESRKILENLQSRREKYAQRGAEYLLVILPNSQTVYSERMPSYMGKISEDTRLSRLEDSLLAGGFTSFVNLTDKLIAHKSDGMLYNNTENSLNSLGLYYTYLAVCEQFVDTVMADTRIIPRGDLSFHHHLTTGKAAARRAGLSDVAMNYTVSLSNSTKLNYKISYDYGWISQSELKPFDYPAEVTGTPHLLLQFSNTWERLQTEPFFSNTFMRVTYQTDLAYSDEAVLAATPRAVIQFIYEYQLSQLLEE